MRPYALLILLVLNALVSLGQNRKIDSLQNLLKQNIPDTTRALSMMRLAIEYEGIDTAVTARTYREGIAFAQSKQLKYALGRLFHNQGIFSNATGQYGLAELSFDSALANMQQTNEPNTTLHISSIYSDYANLCRYINDRKREIDYRLKSIDILEKINRPVHLVNAYINLALLYKEQLEYDKQEFYARKSLLVARTIGQPEAFFKAYTYVAFALNYKGKFNDSETYIDSARPYYSEAFPQDVRTTFHLVAGLTYMNVNKLDKAKKEFTDCGVVAEKFKAPFTLMQSKIQLSRVLALQKNFAAAEPILLAAYKEAGSTQVVSQTVVILDYLARLYEEKGDYKKALYYHKEFKTIEDSVSSESNKQLATSLEAQYDTKRKEGKIGQLTAEKKVQELTIARKNTVNYILIGSAVALLLLSALLYRNYSQKQKLQQQRINELETEKQLAATEAVLKGEEQERTRLAKDLHDGLGGMLSGIKYSLNTMKGNVIMTPENAQAFERSMEMLDSSIREMRRVAHNLMPEALVKFGLDTALKDFCSDINQSGAIRLSYQSLGLENAQIDQTMAITIYRIVQELIHNTIKHAGATSGIVQITNDNGKVAITVEDDGKGFDTAILSASRGIGWTNIQHRVEFLKGTIDVQSGAGNGTSVHIEIGGQPG